MDNKEVNIKLKLKSFIDNIDELGCTFVTYKASLIRSLLELALEEIEEKEQECEELKREIAFGNNGKLSDKIRAIVFKDLNAESSKYKQALDEIEISISEYQMLTLGKPRTMRENDCIYNILDIINKAKGDVNNF